MDPVSRLLILNLSEGSIDKNCVMNGNWQFPNKAGDMSVIRWHTVTSGVAKLEMPIGTSCFLKPGRVALLPQNSAHKICGVDNNDTTLICGSLKYQHSSKYFLTALPELLLLDLVKDSVEYNWLLPCVLLM